MEKWLESLLWYAKFARNVAVLFAIAIFLLHLYTTYMCFAWPFNFDAYLACGNTKMNELVLLYLGATGGTFLFGMCSVVVAIAAGCIWALLQLSGKK